MINPLLEKYDLKKILAEIEEDKDHESGTSQDENISQPVITALKDKIAVMKKKEKS